ncbi:MAG: putative peptidoglycan glycosyltransferase FtsW [Micrococcaceae bacterium]
MSTQTPVRPQNPQKPVSKPKQKTARPVEKTPFQSFLAKAKEFSVNFLGASQRYVPKGLSNDTASYYMILTSTILLVILGVIMVLSASSVEAISQGTSSYGIFLRQLAWAVAGGIALWVGAHVPKDVYRNKKFTLTILWLAIILLAMVQVTPLGKEVNGNKNWLVLGPFSGQPSELAKYALCLYIPYVLSLKRKYLSDPMVVARSVLLPSSIIVFLVWLGHDMGTTLIIIAIIAGGIFIAGVPMKWVMRLGLIGSVGILLLAFGKDGGNRLARIASWRSCGDDLSGLCWQSVSGRYGLASGHWFGVGLGASREKWSWLPEAHNDYIFAVLGEELGFIGTFSVVVLFVVLILAFTRIITRHRDPYIRIATGCVMSWIIVQALVNMGMVVGILPVIGVPLPLISAGGTAMLFTLAAIGMVLSFARTEPKEGDENNTRDFKYRGVSQSKQLKKRTRVTTPEVAPVNARVNAVASKKVQHKPRTVIQAVSQPIPSVQHNPNNTIQSVQNVPQYYAQQPYQAPAVVAQQSTLEPFYGSEQTIVNPQNVATIEQNSVTQAAAMPTTAQAKAIQTSRKNRGKPLPQPPRRARK